MHTSLSKKLLAGLLSLVMVLSLVAPSMGTQAASKYSLTDKKSVKSDVTYKYQLKGVSKNQYVKVTRNVSGETVKYNKKAVSKTTKIKGTGKTLNLYVTYGEKAENYTGKFTVKVYSKKTNKVAKTLVEKVTVKVSEKEAVTSVAINNTTPKVGDTIKATVEPANAADVAYAWFMGDTAETITTAIEGETTDSLTVTEAMIGKFIKVQVTGAKDSVQTAATTAKVVAKEEAELEITAEQTGASKITVKTNKTVTTEDKVAVKRGTSTVDCSFTVDAEGTTITITTGAKIAEAEYEVTVTPKDTTKAAAKATFTGKTAKLEKIDFVGESLIMTNSNYTACSVKIFGYDTFGDKVALSSLQPYSTKGTPTYTAANNEISLTLAGGTQLFTMGEQITVTAVYQDGTAVQQVSKVLTVSSMASVAEMTFGELETTNKNLEGKEVNLTAMKTGTYYKTVSAKDQYGNILNAKELNGMLYNSSTNPTGTLFVTPSQAAGSYVYLDSFDTNSKDEVIAKFKLGALAMPGTQTFTYTAVGGYTANDSITVVDDAYIADLAVSVPELYGGKEAELTITAKDQNGNTVDLYDFVGTDNNGSGAKTIVGAPGAVYNFDDYNSTTKSNSTISVPAGITLKVTKNSAKKTVKFTVTPADNLTAQNVTYILVVQSAKPTVYNVTCSVQTNPAPYGISNKMKTSGTNTAVVRADGKVDLAKEVLILDQYGASLNYAVKVAGRADTQIAAAGTDALTTNGNLSSANDRYYIEFFNASNVANTIASEVSAEGKYVVNLWYDEDGSAAAKKAKLLDSKTFTVVKADTKYSNYKAELSTDGLLYYGKNSTTSSDEEQIKVTATDSTGNKVTLKVGSEYTVSLEDVPTEGDGSATPDSDDSTKDFSVAGNVVKCNEAITYSQSVGEKKGELTANIYVGTQLVTSVKIPYSNAPQKTQSYVVTKNGKAYDLAEGVEIASGRAAADTSQSGTYWYDTTEGLMSLCIDYDGVKATNGTKNPMTAPDYATVSTTAANQVATYVIMAVDQYGLSNFDAKLGTTALTADSVQRFGDYGTITLSGTKTQSFELTTADGEYTPVATTLTGVPVIDAATDAKGTNALTATKKVVVTGLKLKDQHGNSIASAQAASDVENSDAATTTATYEADAEGNVTVVFTLTGTTAAGDTAAITVLGKTITVTAPTAGASAAWTVSM